MSAYLLFTGEEPTSVTDDHLGCGMNCSDRVPRSEATARGSPVAQKQSRYLQVAQLSGKHSRSWDSPPRSLSAASAPAEAGPLVRSSDGLTPPAATAPTWPLVAKGSP